MQAPDGAAVPLRGGRPPLIHAKNPLHRSGHKNSTTPRPSKRDRGATRDSESLSMFQPHAFCRFSFSLRNPLVLGSFLDRAVTLKHRGTFGSILQQYFASEVGRVRSHICESVWNMLPIRISVCQGFALGRSQYQVTLDLLPLVCTSGV